MQKVTFGLQGHLKVWKTESNSKSLVFDDHNLIVNEGKGALMDYLGKDGVVPSYTALPFTSIVLTQLATAENVNDNFINHVFDPVGTNQFSNEGNLHVPTFTSVTHVQGALTLTLEGTITQAFGNDPASNHIRSVGVVMGTNNTAGGPGEPSYSQTGNEKLFSRVVVGDLVKTVDKSYTFSWQFTII